VSLLCETLEVSVSGYYDWQKRPMSQHAHRRLYGGPRIYVELREQGVHCSRKQVARLMHEQGLCARRRAHRTRTSESSPGARVAPTLLNQDFTATRPDEK